MTDDDLSAKQHGMRRTEVAIWGLPILLFMAGCAFVSGYFVYTALPFGVLSFVPAVIVAAIVAHVSGAVSGKCMHWITGGADDE